MSKLLNRFFVVLGVIFFCMLCYGAYFILVDPYNVRPIVQLLWKARTMSPETSFSPVVTSPSALATSSDTTPVEPSVSQVAEIATATPRRISLPAAQAEALQSIGINPAFISQITPEQKYCFIKLFGQARVTNIIAGAVPTTNELLQGSVCL